LKNTADPTTQQIKQISRLNNSVNQTSKQKSNRDCHPEWGWAWCPPIEMNNAPAASTENKWVTARCSTEPRFLGEGPPYFVLAGVGAARAVLGNTGVLRRELQGSRCIPGRSHVYCGVAWKSPQAS